MDYTLRFQDTPRDQILTMMRWASERNDAKAKERKDDYMELMKKLGKGYAAYKMNKDYDDYMAAQNKLNDEIEWMNDIQNAAAYDPETFDPDKQLSLNPLGFQQAYLNNELANPYYVPGNKNATQSDYFKYQLGLRGI